ncbi:L-fucose-proton symporter [Aquimixticola soesokkakensis]|uniref:L-fucose-proton symporter n=1 Tax=Aquimixticola soesokkakensis TaxID=1519096 RepID=A0A1Y5T0M4_9RHOB|nr:L-fucose:H+ symporter permease [Aquimixticola soesokkakensis]SLN51034.1 L-fucose-proton symporter [Aquimixticola soesokkakensis]
MSGKTRLVYQGMWMPFVLLVVCFAAWGIAANMTDPMVQVFSRIFSMSTVQASLVQFAYYGAYFLLALPAAFINRRFSYKTGVLAGLGLATFGALLFYPASIAMTYGFFLIALFCLAGGLSILETSANPFVISMGPEGNATRRLNFAQAFNPVGTNIGVLLSASFILPNLNPATDAQRAAMAPEALEQIRRAELSAVMGPYVGFAFVLLVIWVLIALKPMPARDEARPVARGNVQFRATLARLLKNRHYAFGVGAQFFNVAAQTCTWTFTIQYVIGAMGGTEASAGQYLQISLIVFLISRFAMVGIMGVIRPSLLLTLMAALAVTLTLFAAFVPSMAGVWAVVALSACLSLMFPTIYGVALQGLGEDTKFGAAGLVMAIAGGAVMPMIQGAVLDGYGAAVSFVVPMVCFAVVALYGVFDLLSGRKSAALR